MRKKGWYERPGVTILEGKWQDFIESEELYAVGGFDVIYTDTFSEDYGGKLSRSVLRMANPRLIVYFLTKTYWSPSNMLLICYGTNVHAFLSLMALERQVSLWHPIDLIAC